ncbi:MAG: lyase [Gammaproteobacteria bacterium]
MLRNSWLVLMLICLPAAAEVEIQEWQVPWPDSRPRDPYLAADGQVWFVGQAGNYLASLDPASGGFQRYDLPAGTAPHNLLVADDGRVWFAGNGAAYIGRLTPDSLAIETVDLPDTNGADPHTLVFDGHGDIWFSIQGGNHVGYLQTTSLEFELIPVKTRSARPYGIVTDADNHPWLTLFGSNRLATVNPDTMVLTEIELPRTEARPRRLDVSSEGDIWYVDYAEGYIGRYRPDTAAGQRFREWHTPAGKSAYPYAMAVDKNDNVWFVETGPAANRLVGFRPTTEEFFDAVEIPSGGGTVRHMHYDADSHTLWFGTDANTIGRAILP